MWVTGHVAAGWLAAMRRPLASRARVGWCVVGALWPDLLDKSLMLLGWTPYGRGVGHALAVWAVWACVAWLLRVRGVRWLWWFVVGWLSHLGVDLVDDALGGVLFTGYVFTAWMGWPWWTPDEGQVRATIRWSARRGVITPLEWATLCAAVWVAWRRGRRGSRRGG
jgi:hypothetical protein